MAKTPPARHHQRDVLRRAEGHPVPRHQQHRQRGTGLSRAVDHHAEAGDRRRRDHVLVHRRHRERPHRAVRRQRRQRAAGLHEVPVPGAQARREGRGGQPDARAGPRALLGAEQRRERDVRHEDDRRVLRRAHRRRRRVRQRRAEGAARRGRDRPRVRARAHRGLRRAARRCSNASRSTTSSGSRVRPAPTWSASPGCTRPPTRRCSCGRWASRSTSTAPTTSPRSSTSGSRAATSAGRGAGLMPIRGHSGVQGGAEMGAYATAFPGGVRDHARVGGRARASSTGSRWATAPGLTAEEMIEAASRGEIDVLYSSGGNFLEVLPDPEFVDDALGRVPLRVHQDIVVSSQMLVDPGDVVVLLPAATRYEQRDGGTETTTERRIAFSPEIAGHQVGRGAQRVGDLRRPRAPRRSGARAPRGVRLGSGDPRRDRARRAVVRGHRAPARDRRRGAVGWHAALRGRQLPDARRQGALRRGRARRRATCPRAASCSAPGAASSSTRWCTRERIRSPARCATRCSWRRPTRARSGFADGDRVVVRSDAR